MLLFAAWGAASSLHPFLARSERASANLLVVEGWVREDDLGEVLKEFRSGSYERLCVTGSPLTRGGRFLSFETHAELTAACLLEEGADRGELLVAPGPDVQRHRTFAALAALKAKLEEEGVEVRGLNVYTSGIHARRTQLVCEKLFGPDVAIGVFSLTPVSYDPERWWATSAGLKGVLMETIAYAYEWLADGGRPGDALE